jgi:hypothetical protein
LYLKKNQKKSIPIDKIFNIYNLTLSLPSQKLIKLKEKVGEYSPQNSRISGSDSPLFFTGKSKIEKLLLNKFLKKCPIVPLCPRKIKCAERGTIVPRFPCLIVLLVFEFSDKKMHVFSDYLRTLSMDFFSKM